MFHTRLLIALGILVIIIGVGYFIFQGQNQLTYQIESQQQAQPQAPQEFQESQELQEPKEPSYLEDSELEELQEELSKGNEEFPIITYTDSGFSPQVLTIKAGTIVVFLNESSRDFWPATDVHPTHQVYPGSDIRKCFSEKSEEIFDACEPIKPGASWWFTFNHKGRWNYHDHLNPSFTGTIVVE